MDSFWVIVLFILFAIFSDRKDKKKPVPKRRIPDFPSAPCRIFRSLNRSA
ncbi:hypothetical protein [Selenomonas ruminantium]|nr:hypothetical protein [Selenomonas ruminantium]